MACRQHPDRRCSALRGQRPSDSHCATDDHVRGQPPPRRRRLPCPPARPHDCRALPSPPARPGRAPPPAEPACTSRLVVAVYPARPACTTRLRAAPCRASLHDPAQRPHLPSPPARPGSAPHLALPAFPPSSLPGVVEPACPPSSPPPPAEPARTTRLSATPRPARLHDPAHRSTLPSPSARPCVRPHPPARALPVAPILGAPPSSLHALLLHTAAPSAPAGPPLGRRGTLPTAPPDPSPQPVYISLVAAAPACARAPKPSPSPCLRRVPHNAAACVPYLLRLSVAEPTPSPTADLNSTPFLVAGA